MHSSSIPLPPRQVEIGDAAQLAGTTPETIHRYHDMGLLTECERSSDGHRQYGYHDMIRLLWIHKMVGAGIAVDAIRGANFIVMEPLLVATAIYFCLCFPTSKLIAYFERKMSRGDKR